MYQNVTILFPSASYSCCGPTGEHQEILSDLLLTVANKYLATAVKAMSKYCDRVFECDSNLHPQSLNYMSPFIMS
jgi:hypothetical protein